MATTMKRPSHQQGAGRLPGRIPFLSKPDKRTTPSTPSELAELSRLLIEGLKSRLAVRDIISRAGDRLLSVRASRFEDSNGHVCGFLHVVRVSRELERTEWANENRR
jgi:hypothetical protein